MKHFYLILLTLLINFAESDASLKKELSGIVIKISDGDTITILDNLNKTYRIRLYGIDCPEKGQDYFQVAKDYLGDLCFQKTVYIQIMHTDQYKRPVAKVYVDSLELNYLLLKEGLAWQYTAYDKSRHYQKAQEEAKIKKKNIWSLRNPIAPWEFRKTKRLKTLNKQSA